MTLLVVVGTAVVCNLPRYCCCRYPVCEASAHCPPAWPPVSAAVAKLMEKYRTHSLPIAFHSSCLSSPTLHIPNPHPSPPTRTASAHLPSRCIYPPSQHLLNPPKKQYSTLLHCNNTINRLSSTQYHNSTNQTNRSNRCYRQQFTLECGHTMNGGVMLCGPTGCRLITDAPLRNCGRKSGICYDCQLRNGIWGGFA